MERQTLEGTEKVLGIEAVNRNQAGLPFQMAGTKEDFQLPTGWQETNSGVALCLGCVGGGTQSCSCNPANPPQGYFSSRQLWETAMSGSGARAWHPVPSPAPHCVRM